MTTQRGSPREGVRSEPASGATTGGGGRSAPDPEHVELDRPRMRGGHTKAVLPVLLLLLLLLLLVLVLVLLRVRSKPVPNPRLGDNNPRPARIRLYLPPQLRNKRAQILERILIPRPNTQAQ